MGVPVFSVVMPAYNAGATIAESIESVLAQTLTDWELLIVDDCSTDNTQEVCRGFVDPRIHVFRTERNLNAAGARNLALQYARGEFVAFLDSDDLAAPNRLQRQFEFFEKNSKVGVCGTYVRTFGAKGEGSSEIKYPCSDGAIKATMFFYDPLVTSSVAIRRNLLSNDVGPLFQTEYSVAQDYNLWAQLIDKACFANLPEILGSYRIHTSQITKTKERLVREKVEEVWKYLFQIIGLNDDTVQLQAHRRVVFEREHDLNDLPEFKSWLEALWLAGRKSTFLPVSEWDSTFGLKWFMCCTRCHRKNLRLWNIFRNSPLARHFRSRRRKLELLAKCLLR